VVDDDAGIQKAFTALLKGRGHEVLSATSGEAGLEILEREKLVERAHSLGEAALGLLQGLRSHPHVGDVRGRGLMMGIEIVADKASRRPFPRAEKKAETVGARAFDAGLVTYPGGGCANGTDGDSIMLAPPFVITEAEIDETVAILRAAIEKTMGEIR